MVALLCGVLHAQDNDLICPFVNRVIDEIGIPAGYKLAYARGCLPPPGLREEDQFGRLP
jgi:hypothetical protein